MAEEYKVKAAKKKAAKAKATPKKKAAKKVASKKPSAKKAVSGYGGGSITVSYTHLRAHETP